MKKANGTLSGREIEIADLISRGMETKEIAKLLNVSWHTIHKHKANIFRKLEVSNVAEMVGRCFREGILH